MVDTEAATNSLFISDAYSKQTASNHQALWICLKVLDFPNSPATWTHFFRKEQQAVLCSRSPLQSREPNLVMWPQVQQRQASRAHVLAIRKGGSCVFSLRSAFFHRLQCKGSKAALLGKAFAALPETLPMARTCCASNSARHTEPQVWLVLHL